MGGFVGKVISFIGRPFGIYTHDETFTDLQVSNLLTPGAADKSGRKTARYKSMGDANTYFKGYRSFQRNYRKKYSKKFMENLGYLPTSTAATRTITKSKAEVYIENLYSYNDVDVIVAKDTYLTDREKYNHAVRSIDGYDYPTGHIIDSNKTYIVIGHNIPKEDTVNVNTQWYYKDNIIDNLNTNYNYNGTEVTINDKQYTVGDIKEDIDDNNQYETECTNKDDNTDIQTIKTDVEDKTFTITNDVYTSEASYINYKATSGEVGDELRYYAIASNTVDIYDKANVDVTTIITMKEDNVMVDTNDRKLNRMLNRLNLSGEQLKSSISNDDMDSAYLMTGINPMYDDNITNKALHKMFDLMSSGSGNVNISIDKLSMKYSFGIEKSTVSGSIGKIGTITRENIAATTTTDEDGNTEDIHAGMTLSLQMDNDEYKVLKITNFAMTYTMSGSDFTAYLDSTGGYCRLIIPLDIMNNFKYKEFVWIYERSLCMLAYATKTVTVQWYETGAFGTLLKIVAVAITIVTLGTASSLSEILLTLTSAIAITYVVEQIARVIGGDIGMVLALIAYVAATIYFTPLTFNSIDMWLMTSQQAIGIESQRIAHEAEALMNNIDKYNEVMKKKNEELEQAQEEMDEHTGIGYIDMFNSAYAGRPNPIFRTIEEYCESIVGSTDLSYLVDYGKQITNNIDMRNSVTVTI